MIKRKAVLITGCNGGIGFAISKKLKENDYFLYGLDLHEESSNRFIDEYLNVDLHKLASESSYRNEKLRFLSRSIEKRELEAVINNAAIQILGGIEDLSYEEWGRTLNVNLNAIFLITKCLLGSLKRTRGSVINISSIHARLTKKDFIAYSTSKAALSAFTRSLALDVGSVVRVNGIEPAAINTEMLRAGFNGKHESFSRLEKNHPAGVIGRPDEVASIVEFILTDKLPFLNGAVIALDGGISSVLNDPV